MTMKRLPGVMSAAMVLVLVQAGWAAATGQFKVSAMKKTVSKNKSEAQQRPRGTTRVEKKEVAYEFTLQNQSTEYSQEELEVRWAMMVEKANGESFQTRPGHTNLTLPFGRAVTAESDPVSLSERTWQGVAGRRTAESGQVLKGYGLQILTGSGELLMETYEPESLKAQFQWQIRGKPQKANREERPEWSDKSRRGPR